MSRCVVEFTNNPPTSLLAQRNATRSRTKLLRRFRKSLLDVEGLIFSRGLCVFAKGNYRSKDVWDFDRAYVCWLESLQESLLMSHAHNSEPFKSTLPTSVKRTRDNTLDSTTLTSSLRSKGSLIPSSSSKYKLLLRLDDLEHGSPLPEFVALLYNWKILFIECRCWFYTHFPRSTGPLPCYRGIEILITGIFWRWGYIQHSTSFDHSYSIWLKMLFQYPDLHIFQETRGWVSADYRLYELLNLGITTLCHSLQTAPITTAKRKKGIKKKMHVALPQKSLHLWIHVRRRAQWVLCEINVAYI